MSALQLRWQEHRGVRGAVLCAIALALVIVTWYPSPAPGVGFDPSWQVALHLIADRGLDFGSDVAFPYGPLGFLLFPQTVTGPTWALAFVATVLLRVALVALVIAATRRAVGHLAPAVVAGYLTAALLGPLITIPGLLAVVLALVLLQNPVRKGRAAWLVPVALGAFTAMALLIKLDSGVVALSVLSVAALAQWRGGWRAGALWAAGLLVAFTIGWTATGNRLGDIPRWVAWSREVVGGYSGGAVLTDERIARAWHLPVFGAAALAVMGLAAWAWRRQPRLPRVGLWLVLVVALWVEMKHGFVRHDTHVVGTFLAVGLLPLALAWRQRAGAIVSMAVAAVGLAAAFGPLGVGADERLTPSGARTFGSEAWMLVDAASRHRHISAARDRARRELAIDPAVLEAVADTPVHVAPHATAVVWAYGLAWRPLPQFQSFSTWTAELDDVNGRMLAAPSGPPLVIRADVARLDLHHPLFESPRENLELICRYRQARLIGGWELLDRGPSRCGPARRLGDLSVDARGRFTIPAARDDELVYLQVRWQPSLLERLRATVFRPSALPRMSFPQAPNRRPFRVPVALLGQPLVVRVPESVAMPRRLRVLASSTEGMLIGMPGAHVEAFAQQVAPAV